MGYRILVINWRDIRNPEAGGAEVHFHETFTRIAADNHHVTLLCSQFPGAAPYEWIDGIEIFRYGRKHTFNLTVPWVYRNRLARSNFDIIVEDLNKIPFFLPRFTDRPILALVHHLFGTSIFRETNPVFASYIYLAERMIPSVYRACLFEVVSESTKAELVRMGLPPERITVVHNGIDHRIFDGAGALDEKTTPLIIYLGRLKRYKNVDQLVHAMRFVVQAVPGVRLVIVGEGDQRSALQSLSTDMGLNGAIQFVGFIPDQHKVDLLRRAAVAAFPSSKEGWGLTVIEANACFTPVVATDVAGLRDAVVDEQTGFLVRPGDVQALADKLIVVLRDHQMRTRLATNAAAWAGRFTWEETAEQTFRIIDRVVREHAR